MGGGEKIVAGELKGKLVLKFISISEINPVALAASKFPYDISALASLFFSFFFFTKARFRDKFNPDGV